MLKTSPAGLEKKQINFIKPERVRSSLLSPAGPKLTHPIGLSFF